MDALCKKAFIIIFGTPTVLSLIVGWIFLGSETIKGSGFFGLLEGFSLMWIPTIFVISIAGIIDKILFKGSLLNCFEQKLQRIKK